MSTFDELVNVIEEHSFQARSYCEDAAEAILARFTVVEPRIVTTVEELNAIRVDTVIRETTKCEWVWEKHAIDPESPGRNEWYRMGYDTTFDAADIELPAVVLYTTEAQS